MLRAAWLTYRMHRFEVVISALLMVVLAVSVLIVTTHLTSLDISGTCWQSTRAGDFEPFGCAEMERFWDIARSEAGYARAGLGLVAPIVGLILGVPIVAREVELRTTSLAWSLTLHRGRWLLSRLLPMLALASAGFLVLGWVGSGLFQAMEVGWASPSLTEVASQGPTLMARGLMALGIAVFVGAVIGRTMPALLIAAVAVIAWSLFGVPTVQQSMFEERAVWVNEGEGWGDGLGPIGYAGGGEFDTSKPGVDGEPGARFDYEAFHRQQVELCGQPPQDEEDGDSPESRAWWTCAEQIPYPDDLYWSKVVPASTYPDFQLAELAVDAGIGGAAFILTFPVVARRRPS
ncbi:MAG: hypothetical protein M3395_00180 [Chloroflexota bacterium]|nr:hypothetical protein [Chloroflexota bacterium]